MSDKNMKSPALPRGFSASAKLYLKPLGVMPANVAPPEALPLAGGPLVFNALEVAVRVDGRTHRATASIANIQDWAAAENRDADVAHLLKQITSARTNIAGLDFSQPRVMGILNVTPDSFHDGGLDADAASAIARGRALHEAGAHIVDVGGESTRPGAAPVPENEELARVLPVVEGLTDAAVISIDSRRAGVLSRCLEQGAGLANDVHALTGDGCLEAVAQANAPVILMHGPADPTVMQRDTDYTDVSLETWDWLAGRIKACEDAGISAKHILVDPGIGFSKTAEQSARVLGDIALYHSLGCAVVLGASRKSFIAGVSAGEASEDRLAGSITAVNYALSQGVQVLRVHDVAQTVQAIAVWRSLHC
ncbi:MAG: dihydropteroate synthase [Alphaproteobacteria bacterium]|jgi:dihydropteroate synthase|nr:dihydropteroate synthase [Alphaproteobacteria bacterium]MBT4018805.1 dihydropteroate synthase [Alphaproteobacteria bacterium]MBT4965158.1 dihydropteroate synthase [Alphaproteobacteria bacterium]MBT5159450.1 dihydropteroate synthase [Alphaproteobacteria bacterium]MBT5918882.1 dihydropteroate synthase [Alphaproteobacteria bacterium]